MSKLDWAVLGCLFGVLYGLILGAVFSEGLKKQNRPSKRSIMEASQVSKAPEGYAHLLICVPGFVGAYHDSADAHTYIGGSSVPSSNVVELYVEKGKTFVFLIYTPKLCGPCP